MFDGYHFSGTISGVALVAATPQTVVQLTASASNRPQVTGFSVSFDGNVASVTPALVEIARQTTAGTMSNGTEVSLSDSTYTSSAAIRHTATAEPSTSDVIYSYYVPQDGSLTVSLPPGEEIQLPTSGRVGIRVTSPDIVNVSVNLIWKD